MIMHVQLFAAAKEAAGVAVVEVALSDGATVSDLREQLVVDVPTLEGLRDTLLIAVNSEYAGLQNVLNVGDDVACFPPVSGG